MEQLCSSYKKLVGVDIMDKDTDVPDAVMDLADGAWAAQQQASHTIQKKVTSLQSALQAFASQRGNLQDQLEQGDDLISRLNAQCERLERSLYYSTSSHAIPSTAPSNIQDCLEADDQAAYDCGPPLNLKSDGQQGINTDSPLGPDSRPASLLMSMPLDVKAAIKFSQTSAISGAVKSKDRKAGTGAIREALKLGRMSHKKGDYWIRRDTEAIRDQVDGPMNQACLFLLAKVRDSLSKEKLQERFQYHLDLLVMKKKCEEEVKQVILQREETLRTALAEKQAMIDSLTQSHEEEIIHLRHEHQQAMQLLACRDKDMRQLQQTHQEAMQKMQDEHQFALERMHQHHSEAVKQLLQVIKPEQLEATAAGTDSASLCQHPVQCYASQHGTATLCAQHPSSHNAAPMNGHELWQDGRARSPIHATGASMDASMSRGSVQKAVQDVVQQYCGSQSGVKQAAQGVVQQYSGNQSDVWQAVQDVVQQDKESQSGAQQAVQNVVQQYTSRTTSAPHKDHALRLAASSCTGSLPDLKGNEPDEKQAPIVMTSQTTTDRQLASCFSQPMLNDPAQLPNPPPLGSSNDTYTQTNGSASSCIPLAEGAACTTSHALRAAGAGAVQHLNLSPGSPHLESRSSCTEAQTRQQAVRPDMASFSQQAQTVTHQNNSHGNDTDITPFSQQSQTISHLGNLHANNVHTPISQQAHTTTDLSNSHGSNADDQQAKQLADRGVPCAHDNPMTSQTGSHDSRLTLHSECIPGGEVMLHNSALQALHHGTTSAGEVQPVGSRPQEQHGSDAASSRNGALAAPGQGCSVRVFTGAATADEGTGLGPSRDGGMQTQKSMPSMVGHVLGKWVGEGGLGSPISMAENESLAEDDSFEGTQGKQPQCRLQRENGNGSLAEDDSFKGAQGKQLQCGLQHENGNGTLAEDDSFEGSQGKQSRRGLQHENGNGCLVEDDSSDGSRAKPKFGLRGESGSCKFMPDAITSGLHTIGHHERYHEAPTETVNTPAAGCPTADQGIAGGRSIADDVEGKVYGQPQAHTSVLFQHQHQQQLTSHSESQGRGAPVAGTPRPAPGVANVPQANTAFRVTVTMNSQNRANFSHSSSDHRSSHTHHSSNKLNSAAEVGNEWMAEPNENPNENLNENPNENPNEQPNQNPTLVPDIDSRNGQDGRWDVGFPVGSNLASSRGVTGVNGGFGSDQQLQMRQPEGAWQVEQVHQMHEMFQHELHKVQAEYSTALHQREQAYFNLLVDLRRLQAQQNTISDSSACPSLTSSMSSLPIPRSFPPRAQHQPQTQSAISETGPTPAFPNLLLSLLNAPASCTTSLSEPLDLDPGLLSPITASSGELSPIITSPPHPPQSRQPIRPRSATPHDHPTHMHPQDNRPPPHLGLTPGFVDPQQYTPTEPPAHAARRPDYADKATNSNTPTHAYVAITDGSNPGNHSTQYPHRDFTFNQPADPPAGIAHRREGPHRDDICPQPAGPPAGITHRREEAQDDICPQPAGTPADIIHRREGPYDDICPQPAGTPADIIQRREDARDDICPQPTGTPADIAHRQMEGACDDVCPQPAAQIPFATQLPATTHPASRAPSQYAEGCNSMEPYEQQSTERGCNDTGEWSDGRRIQGMQRSGAGGQVAHGTHAHGLVHVGYTQHGGGHAEQLPHGRHAEHDLTMDSTNQGSSVNVNGALVQEQYRHGTHGPACTVRGGSQFPSNTSTNQGALNVNGALEQLQQYRTAADHHGPSLTDGTHRPTCTVDDGSQVTRHSGRQGALNVNDALEQHYLHSFHYETQALDDEREILATAATVGAMAAAAAFAASVSPCNSPSSQRHRTAHVEGLSTPGHEQQGQQHQAVGYSSERHAFETYADGSHGLHGSHASHGLCELQVCRADAASCEVGSCVSMIDKSGVSHLPPCEDHHQTPLHRSRHHHHSPHHHHHILSNEPSHFGRHDHRPPHHHHVLPNDPRQPAQHDHSPHHHQHHLHSPSHTPDQYNHHPPSPARHHCDPRSLGPHQHNHPHHHNSPQHANPHHSHVHHAAQHNSYNNQPNTDLPHNTPLHTSLSSTIHQLPPHSSATRHYSPQSQPPSQSPPHLPVPQSLPPTEQHELQEAPIHSQLSHTNVRNSPDPLHTAGSYRDVSSPDSRRYTAGLHGGISSGHDPRPYAAGSYRGISSPDPHSHAAGSHASVNGRYLSPGATARGVPPHDQVPLPRDFPRLLSTHTAAGLGCEQALATVGSERAEALSHGRVCQRCGLNDEISPGACRFHPALLPQPNSFQFTPEWQACLAARHSASSAPGCYTRTRHFYPPQYKQSKDVAVMRKGPHSSMKTDPHSMRKDPYSMRTDPHSMRRTNPHSMRTDPHSMRTDPHSMRTESHSMSTESHSMRTDSYTMSPDPHSMRTDPHSMRADPHSTRTDPHTAKTHPCGASHTGADTPTGSRTTALQGSRSLVSVPQDTGTAAAARTRRVSHTPLHYDAADCSEQSASAAPAMKPTLYHHGIRAAYLAMNDQVRSAPPYVRDGMMSHDTKSVTSVEHPMPQPRQTLPAAAVAAASSSTAAAAKVLIAASGMSPCKAGGGGGPPPGV